MSKADKWERKAIKWCQRYGTGWGSEDVVDIIEFDSDKIISRLARALKAEHLYRRLMAIVKKRNCPILAGLNFEGCSCDMLFKDCKRSGRACWRRFVKHELDGE